MSLGTNIRPCQTHGALLVGHSTSSHYFVALLLFLKVENAVNIIVSQRYGEAIVASKVPLPNYRPDLDDMRPQREVRKFSKLNHGLLFGSYNWLVLPALLLL